MRLSKTRIDFSTAIGWQSCNQPGYFTTIADNACTACLPCFHPKNQNALSKRRERFEQGTTAAAMPPTRFAAAG